MPGRRLAAIYRSKGNWYAELLALPYVATVEQQVGRAEDSDDTFGPHQSEFQVEIALHFPHH